MLALQPRLAIPMLMTISLVTQAASMRSLRDERVALRGAGGPCERVLPYLLGGLLGMPVGLEILARADPTSLKVALGLLLLAYVGWSLLTPSARPGPPSGTDLRSALLVGAAGGVVGGISAFPGSALVIWNGVRGLAKAQSRALLQPFILVMQLIGLVLLWAGHRSVFDATFLAIFVFALPVALVGNSVGIAIYRRTGDIGYRRVCLAAIAVSGTALLAKALA